MNVTREDKKIEAIKRMKALGIFPETIRQFEKDGLVSIGEPPLGGFYWANDELKEIIRQFEEQYSTLVFVGIKSYTEFGTMYSLLYVSDHSEEWEMDWEGVRNPEDGICAYVYNADAPDCSEIGSIGARLNAAKSLTRIW